jgi:hypothetical protein
MSLFIYGSRDGSFGIATGYWMESPGSIQGMAKFVSPPQRPDRVWGQTTLLSSGGTWDNFSRGKPIITLSNYNKVFNTTELP